MSLRIQKLAHRIRSILWLVAVGMLFCLLVNVVLSYEYDKSQKGAVCFFYAHWASAGPPHIVVEGGDTSSRSYQGMITWVSINGKRYWPENGRTYFQCTGQFKWSAGQYYIQWRDEEFDPDAQDGVFFDADTCVAHIPTAEQEKLLEKQIEKFEPYY